MRLSWSRIRAEKGEIPSGGPRTWAADGFAVSGVAKVTCSGLDPTVARFTHGFSTSVVLPCAVTRFTRRLCLCQLVPAR